jgi:hypothetical protein
MSALYYFCPVCGDDLIYVQHRRFKCYKCERYFSENFICRCSRRDSGFKYSAEIIAPNKVKCFFCGREARVAASLEPVFSDKYRRGAGSGGLGSWGGEVNVFQKPVQKAKKAAKPKETPKPEMENPAVDYISEDQIIIRFPGHNSLDQIRCKIIDGGFEVQSLLVNFLEKFLLPDFPIEVETDFKNAVLAIRFKSKHES